MPAPKDVIAQLLSPAQAEVLQAVGEAVWQAAASAIESFSAAAPAVAELNGRLVMPDEIIGEYADRHLVLPLTIKTDRDQSATAYAVADTAMAAMFFDISTDDPADQASQTILFAATLLGQIGQALNRQVFARSTAGLQISFGDIAPDAMPALLGALDEPALALTAMLTSGKLLPFSLVLPGTFLDIVAGGMPANFDASEPAGPEPSAAFSLTADDLDFAEIVDEPVPAAPPPTPISSAPSAAAAPPPPPPPAPASREPTPISQAAPSAQRARFAPLPDPEPAVSRSGMDLLAGLQMHVRVELGRSSLTVAEVLALGPGSVVELDRLAGEPVDILVNERIVARGEVVVVDENFGVRVVEVLRRPIDPEEVAS